MSLNYIQARIVIGTIALSILAWAAFAAAAEPGVRLEREAYAMGTRLHLSVEAVTREAARDAGNAALDAVASLEARLSSWRPDSELSLLNRAPPGEPVAVSEPVFDLLRRAWEISAETDGAFDPVVGAFIDAWDLRGSGRLASDAELERARASAGRRCFDLSPATRTVTRLCPAAWIDAGAFGKGAALAEVAAVFGRGGVIGARVDFGGQLLRFGRDLAPGADIAIADPARRERAALSWRSGAASFATTGQSERALAVDGRRLGHVVDPGDGTLVPAWGSVTVAAADPLLADALSTALFVMGPGRGLRWLAARPEVHAVFLLRREDGLEACGRAGGADALAPLGRPRLHSSAVEIAPGVTACGAAVGTMRRAP